MEPESRTLNDYLISIKYRLRLVLGVMAAVFSAALLLAVTLPSVYQSTATILIEQPEIPSELVRSTITTYADQRVQIVSRRVMTTGNLAAVVRKYELYPDEVATSGIEAAAEIMRSTDIQMNLVSAGTTDPKSGKPVQTTIAFTVSYEAASPQLAQQVTNDVAQLYLAENVRARTEQGAGISSFLGAEAARLKSEVAEFEAQMASFKERNAGRLPELSTLNVQTLDRIEVELREVDRQLRTAESQRIAMQSQAAQLEASESPVLNAKVVTPGQRLIEAQTEYLALASKYSDDHPDVVRARKELDSLREATGGGSGGTSLVRDQLIAKRTELSVAQNRYSAEHPDILRLTDEVAELERELKAASRAGRNLSRDAVRSSPAYIQVQSGIYSAEAEARSLGAKQAELIGRRAEYESRLVQAPQVEREYRELSRGYEASVAKLKDVQAKQLEAQLSQNLETKQKAERFELLEPAALPEAPIRPNRVAIVFLGLVFALAAGLGAMVIAEALDDTVRGSRGVAGLLHAPPLAVIPLIGVDGEARGSVALGLAAHLLPGGWLVGLAVGTGRALGLY